MIGRHLGHSFKYLPTPKGQRGEWESVERGRGGLSFPFSTLATKEETEGKRDAEVM